MKPKPCKYCGSSQHVSLMCFNKPRRPLKWRATKTYNKEIEAKYAWFAANPPNADGEWICYLQISPGCPIRLTRGTIVQEHVKSKARYPELRYDITNRKPACDPCNAIKGSRDLEDLRHLGVIIDTAEGE